MNICILFKSKVYILFFYVDKCILSINNIGGVILILFGNNLKKYREMANLTQEELASEITSIYNYPLNKTTISQLENKRIEPNMELLKHLSDYFNISMDVFAFGSSENHEELIYIMKYKILDLVFNNLNNANLDELYSMYHFFNNYIKNIKDKGDN